MGCDSLFFLSDNIDDNLLCSIFTCTDVLASPQSACAEGHVFCAECLLRVKATNSKAPSLSMPATVATQIFSVPNCVEHAYGQRGSL